MKKILNPPNDIYSLILQHNRHNKLITYIIRLIQAYENKEIGYDFFGINPSYLECFAMAIHIFISYNDNPQKVVDQALHFDKSVLRFLTWMLVLVMVLIGYHKNGLNFLLILQI